jgi:hypothetical protein
MDVSKLVQQIVQALAIIMTGIWAYFKFLRGRTFSFRLELTLEPKFVGSEGAAFLATTLTLKNTGLAVVRLDPKLKFVRSYYSATVSWNEARNHSWGEELILTPIFEDHDHIEPGETINDNVVIPLPPGCYRTRKEAVFRVVGEVWARQSPWRRDWRGLSALHRFIPQRKNYRWSATGIVSGVS